MSCLGSYFRRAPLGSALPVQGSQLGSTGWTQGNSSAPGRASTTLLPVLSVEGRSRGGFVEEGRIRCRFAGASLDLLLICRMEVLVADMRRVDPLQLSTGAASIRRHES